MADESQLRHEYLNSLVVYLMESTQICNYELLHFLGELQTKILDARVSVFLVGRRDEEHGIWEENLQVVSEGAHVMRASLEAMNKDEQVVVLPIDSLPG